MLEHVTIAIDDPEAPEAAARVVATGGVIAFPTDTVYGLGAGVWRPDAIARLYTLKGRPDEKALPVLLADAGQWTLVASGVSEGAKRLMARYWPGALTIVLPRRPEVPDAVGPLTATIALRVPDHAALQRVLARTGPLASSSANRSGRPPATSAAQVQSELGHGLALVLDGGAPAGRSPSTVVDMTRATPAILREGAITEDEIMRAVAGESDEPGGSGEYTKP